MHYKVFLDTNIYDSSGFSFRNELFSQLRKYAQDGILELQINSVVKGEVIRHIKKDVKKAAKDVKNSINNRFLAGIRKIDEFIKAFDLMDPIRIMQIILGEFEQLLVDCKAETINANGIDVEALISDYFGPTLPFSDGKKDEFPDALIIYSIIQEIKRLVGDRDFLYYISDGVFEDDMNYCIISSDKGFSNRLKEIVGEKYDGDVKFYDNLKDFITYLTTQDAKAEELQNKFNCGFAIEVINEAIKVALEDASYSFDEPDGYETDITEVETRYYKYKSNITHFNMYEDNTINATVYIDVDFIARIEYEFFNASESYWDKEDSVYLSKVYTNRRADFRAVTSLSFSIEIGDNGEATFLDYVEIPSEININVYDIIEIISTESNVVQRD